MKRKFINVMCTMALAFVIGASFVGCKDYDDDINDLQKQIDKVASDLATLKSSMGKYVQSVAYDSKTGLLTVTGGDGSTASATIQQNLPAYTISVSSDGKTVNLLQDGKVISSAAITFPAQSKEFDPAKLTVVDGKIMYDGVATGVTLPKTTQSSLVAFTDADGNTLGYTITVGETTADFYIQDATPLKSMVFVPETYLGGIEAKPIVTFEFNTYKQTTSDEPATTTGEVWTKMIDGNYSYQPSTVLYYHLNPSTVTKAQIKSVIMLVSIKDYVDVRAGGEAKFLPDSYEVEDGILKITISGTEVYQEDHKICIIAAQAQIQLNKSKYSIEELMDKQDNIASITSDYSAVYPEKRKELYIYHTAALKDNINNTHTVVENNHLYGTNEAPYSAQIALNYAPDYKFDYDKTIDVKQLVKVKYYDEAGIPHYIPVDKLGDYGLSLNYALSNYIGAANNATPQNEFASLSADGILSSRVYEGSGIAAVGRQPLVRYEVRDVKNAKVVAVGWMKFLITKTLDVVKDFGAGTYTCDGLTNTFTVKDMNTEVYNKLELSYEAFHAAYSGFISNNGIGDNAGLVISSIPDTHNLETAVLTWVIPANQLDLTKPDKVYTHICYYTNPMNSSDRIAFKFSTKATGFPTVTIDASSKIAEYWYGANKDSVKVNVATPESGVDDNPAHCRFTSDLNALFIGNQPILKPGATNGASFQTFTYHYAFSSKNTGRKVKGVSGTTYTLGVINNDDYSFIHTTTGQVIATIDITTGEISYTENDQAKDILNISSHKDHPFFTYVDVVGKAACGNGLVAETFKAAFLRPIDMAGVAGKYFEDARDGGDTLKLMDLVSLTDWRDQAFSAHPNYYGFYDIEIISDITMVAADITTNLGGGTLGTTKLTSVTNQIAISQANAAGHPVIIYKNNGFNVQEFTLRIPFKVKYLYGKFISYVDVLVKHTINNPTSR